MKILGASLLSTVAVMLAITATAGAGAQLTVIGPWYHNLRKPVWNPPTWVFPIAWTLIFLMFGIAVIMGWNSSRGTRGLRAALVVAFISNLLSNVGWSTLFFYRRRPDLALREVGLLWLTIVALIVIVRSLSTVGAWLLVPYLLWASFASVLNQRIVSLNEPFPPL